MSENTTIRENSYLCLLGEGDEAKIVALCEICAKKENQGWFWNGKALGYGDYDLFCNSCGNAIYIRDTNANKTSD
jgi:hypothetical protein